MQWKAHLGYSEAALPKAQKWSNLWYDWNLNKKNDASFVDSMMHFLSLQQIYSFLHPFTNKISCLNGGHSAKQQIAFPVLAKECLFFQDRSYDWAELVFKKKKKKEKAVD